MTARLGISNIIFMTLVVMAMFHKSLAQTTHVVGDALGWTFPPGGEVAYRTWAGTRNFAVGDVLVFNFTTGSHDVAEVTKDSFDSCNGNNPISRSTDGPANITLTSSGEHHFICTFTGHCGAGMKLSINVVSSPAVSPAPSPAETTTPPPVATPATAPAPARAAMTYTVGDSLGWTVPPGGSVAYQTWARGKSFFVGDTLVFNFPTNRHDVVEVTEDEYDSCNTSSTAIITTGPARITLNSSGEHYYICTIPGHCPAGQKLAINVTAGGATATPPVSPSTPSSTPPSGSTTAPPPPDSSTPSLAVATLPLTFLAVAFAVLYN
ncbi:blue copper protein-like [Primulina tabacum]|uniref:blue copper protein-like n=1 Tax=Primulina tabacum TaxID=48773 RepID=UPI003F593E08